MVVVDRREAFIVSTASHFFGISPNNALEPEDHMVLDRFLDTPQSRTLCAQPGESDDSSHLRLSNEASGGKNTLVFFKLSASSITNDNFHELVQVASTGGNSGSALIEALRQVWAPTLESSGLSTSYLKKLEEDLLGPRPASTLLEEEASFRKKKEDAKRSSDRKLFEEACRIVKDIRVELETAAISRDGLSAAEEVLEAVAGSVDDLWKLDGPVYSEDQMKSLLNIIGDEVVALVQSLLDEIRGAEVRMRDEAFKTAANVCEKWVSVSQRLTTLFWPHHSLHPWRGSSFSPPRCSKFADRLRQASEVRLQHRQLTRLLTENERSLLGTENLLQNFDDMKLVLGEEEKDLEWERLKRRLEEGLAPAEERVTEKLKKQFAGAGSPALLVGEFQRYVELMKREGIKRSLRTERESLLAALDDLVETYQSGPDTEDLLDVPRILQEVQAARAAEVKLEGLQGLSKDLLSDLPGFKDALSRISSAMKDAESRRQSLVETWVNDTRDAINSKELTLGADSAVVELVGSSMMKVNYDPRLTQLVKEARALSGQGIELPREIRELVERAGALAGRARSLQQVANFHNTIGDRMVPSQRPLMLATALELARAVHEQSGVVWSDLHAVDVYTARLREFVRKFARQNSELAAKHVYLRDLVAGLLKGEVVNLVGSQSAWKDALRNMRSVVDEVDSHYGNTKAWKLHWDRQLLKVLGVAYRAALPNLIRKLQEIRVELTFRDGCLQWRPPLEEIRAKLYSGVRRFLAIPTNFRGVGDPADGKFGSLVQRSAYLYGGVYKEAEVALSGLEEVRMKWVPLAAPARVDIGEQLKGKPPQDWERAFKDAKQWAQEVGKLRGGEVRVWCLCIDTSTTRNDLESASRRYWDRLSSDLRAEASSRLVGVVDFLSAAARELDRRPKDVEEVGLAFEAHKRITEESAGIGGELEAVTGLARVMAAWTREKLDGISGAHAAWEGLADRLERHKTVVARQLEDAKINLRHRAVALRDERERWEARWSDKPETVTLDWVASMRERWTALEEQKDSLISDCTRVGLNLDEILEDDVEVSRRLEAELDAEESNCRFQEEFVKELENQEAEEWSVARRRLPRLHDWLDSWEARIKVHLKDPEEARSEQQKEVVEVDTFVGKKIKEVRSGIEWVQILRGDELAEEHWNDLKGVIGVGGNMRDITLGHLLRAAPMIKENVEKVKEISRRATAESGIRQALIELEAWEASASLHLQQSKDSKNAPIHLVGEYGELLARAGELKLLLEGAKGASGYERFAARAARCETALVELEERLKALGSLQRKWVYLEPVYGSGAAPSDSGKWARADKEFRYLMGEVARDPRVPSLRRLPMPALVSLKDLLDRCQRSLDEFLEEKRSAYPRLYFLSDEDLLELISGSAAGLDAHLPKLYQGIGSVQREDGRLTAVVSPEGEILALPVSIDLSDPLPTWLSNLEEVLRKALAQSLEKCLVDPNADPSLYPAQVLLLSERIHFTERCESALQGGKSALKRLVEFLETQRAKFRGLEDAGDPLTAQKARSLLLDTVHHLDITRNLMKIVERGGPTRWTWNRQLRFYRSRLGPIVKCAGAEFSYRFEYHGAAIGLVRTPLTERCFLALTQAMKLGLGGSPTGPAGTGKTESVKALAAILGRLVLVFNCDEGMDAGVMKRILGGLAQAGAWGCFDEFNRLEEKTLSAVAMLVRPLQEAVRDGSTQVSLGDQVVNLDPHCCVFITMNPAGDDYGGRNKLPDSLARLFRPIGMAHPDRYDIVKSLLECGGFLEASSLAHQVVETLDISEKLLSKQPHYDWGLRALRSVLDAVSPSGTQTESERLLEAIRAAILPKLTEEDTDRFLELLKDVFPRTSASEVSDSEVKRELRKVLEEICQTRSIQGEVASRCEQLYDQLKNRTGVAIVGPPGCGKTLVRNVLGEALGRSGDTVKQILIFPGAIPKTRLLGKVDPQTREWKEGLLSSAIASAGSSALWIVLNGDVEPGWAEALNSALDDNRLLTLPSGVGIKLGAGVRFIFETHKLSGASPATVSRLGVVHLGSAGPSAFLTSSRLDELPPVARNVASAHLPAVVGAALKFSGETISASGLIGAVFPHLVKATSMNLVTQGLILTVCLQLENDSSREETARLIYQLTDSWCPDPERPLNILYNPELDRLEPFSEVQTSVNTEEGPVSLSSVLQQGLVTILPWIESGQAILLRGPRGSGRSSLISAALSSLKDGLESLSVVKGSSLFGPQDLTARLKRACVKLESSVHGRTYRPRSGGKVVLVLEDIHLASEDLQELVRQLLQEGGFHEEDLEFATLPVTLISTADTSTNLHPRLSSLLAVHRLPHPTPRATISIAEVHLESSLKSLKIPSTWISTLASAMHESLSSVSSHKNSTFSWSSRDLAQWARALESYPAPEHTNEITQYLLDSGKRLFYPKLPAKEQTRWRSSLISRIPESSDLSKEIYIWKGSGSLLPLGPEEWQLEIEGAATKCAREGDPVSTTISPHLLTTVAGICWAFGSGHRGVVLTGRPGAGRKSAAKLAASFSSLRLIDAGPGRGRVGVRAAVQAAGVDGEPTLLLLEEHHAREEGLAVLAGVMVSRGEIPGLLSPEELDGLVAPLNDLARKEDFTGTLDQFLYHRLRKLLHVVVILDLSDVRREWLIQSGLLQHCVLVAAAPGGEWWTIEGSLMELGTRVDKSMGGGEESAGMKALVEAHLRAPKGQQSPGRFLALLNTWRELKDEWSHDVERKLESLEAGIGRLREAGERVAKLEEEASKQRKELEEEKGRANAALEQITATMRGATGQRGEMSTLKADTEKESIDLAKRKAVIERELGKVEPLVEAAAQAVAGIGADALAEVRSLRAPPAAVRDVLEGVLRLMGIRDTSWNSMKTFLAKRGVKDEIRTWDARRSTPASLEAVAKLIKERPESFEEKTAKRASVAAAPLAAWVLANLQYGQILQQVAPLEREQRQLSEKLSAAEAQIDKLAAGLNSVETRVAQLQEQLAEHSRGAAALQLRTEATEASLSTARALLQKLDVEHSDWQTQFEALTSRRTRLDVEAAEVASLIVYQDPGRDDKWKKSALELLVTERERLLWRAQDLPTDTGSLVGAACALKGPLVPLFMDSSGIAVTWLKANFGNRLESTKPEDSKFLTTLELAVRFGKPLLVEEVVELPAILLPLLRKRSLRLGDRTLPAQSGFKLFLATRRDGLDTLPSEADAVLFKITLGAGSRSLAERFVEKALLRDTPELEKQRREALELEEKLSGERDAARLDLLAQLGAARGQDLLQESQDGGLLSSLETTQAKAREIAKALEESRRRREEVSKRSKEHEKLAKFAAGVFKAVKSLTALSPLYVFSVDSFTEIYLEADAQRGQGGSSDAKEQESLVEKKLISLTLHHCSKAAYRKHRLPLALHLSLSLDPVPENERNLLQDGVVLKKEDEDSRVPEWVPEERKSAVKALASTLPQVASKIKSDWLEDPKNIYRDPTLTAFQKVLAVQALRPDHLHSALTKLTAEQLGVRDLAPPPWSLEKISEKGQRPVLLLLSPGADPGPELRALVSRFKLPEGFIEVSLGQGQVGQAEAALERVCRNGGWLLLSNLQLALNWLPRLESLLRSSMCTKDKNPATRIWLTTEECRGFYPGLAGICEKLAYEPPEGVKRNLKRSLKQLQQQKSQGNNSEGLFVLAWLHAVLQERRRFVPQGWIRPYEWSEADLEAARELVVSDPQTPKSEVNLDWEEGRGLLDVAIYGGRLQDEFDMRALGAILRNTWAKEVFQGQSKLAGILSVPEACRRDTARAIEQLPDSDAPVEFFGLPANALRAWERSAAETAISVLKSMSSKASSSIERRAARRVESKLLRDLSNYIEQQNSQVKGAEGTQRGNNPVENFFIDEKRLLNRLIQLVKSDLENSGVDGGKTPKSWLEEWPSAPREALLFVNELLTKHRVLNAMENGIPRTVDLSSLTRARAFLAALKQFTARESASPLEGLVLRAHWVQGAERKEWENSIVVEGLLISGAVIREGFLRELDSNAPPIVAAPCCQLSYVPGETDGDDTIYNRHSLKHQMLEIPVYCDSERNELICSLPVGCPSEDRDEWLRRGVTIHLGGH
ncbi:cytoplasmic dynein 2 heavy chain 1 [Diachasma alloeum]|uniref:cytoplasmic dynein 2 heavy chain 1 n=1 Tax=Diachasma alloeum TaxID=454923 RepID=UPI0007381B6B|nr:cytoplasmic dynein 2 heavy chain 1 [Diachasma alloeum]